MKYPTINHDIYEEAVASVKGDFYGKSEEDKLKQAQISRESELRADKDAIFMVANSGFPIDSCRRFLVFMNKSGGYVITDHPDNTHPSNEQRYSNAEKITEEYKKPKRLKTNMPREWRYDKLNNYLFADADGQITELEAVLRRLSVVHCHCELLQTRQQALRSSACSPANG